MGKYVTNIYQLRFKQFTPIFCLFFLPIPTWIFINPLKTNAPDHKETNQLIWNASPLTTFYMI